MLYSQVMVAYSEKNCVKKNIHFIVKYLQEDVMNLYIPFSVD